MRRREVLKGLTTAAGSALLPVSQWPVFAQPKAPGASKELPLAVPIRALARRAGALVQPIQISIRCSAPSATAVSSVNGAEVDRRVVQSGVNTFLVFTQPVSEQRNADVSVTVGDQAALTSSVSLDPVRKFTAYILPHSHHDLGYTDLQPKIEERQINNIELGIELARKTADYPEHARFVWNLEVLWGADLYMRRKSPAERAAFIDAVKRGWVALNGMYANELTGLCRPEELLQLFRYSEILRKQCGVPLDSAMLSDVPGFTWGTVTALAQAGIRYFSCGPNGFDRVGRLRDWYDKPFWLLSRSGKETVLVWMPWHGYNIPPLNLQMMADWQQALDRANFPYDISYMRWSGHGDNGQPDPDLPEFVKTWNQQFDWPRLIISSTSEAFAAFEKRHGAEIPELHGDLTPFWEDGAGSSALETRINRNSADRLTQAAAMAAMLGPWNYRPTDFNDAWRNILLYSEHTWGAAGSVRDPDSAMTRGQWAFKRQFALDGESQSKSLLAAAVNSRAAGTNASAVDVYNATSWPRAELLFLPKALSSAGDHVKDSRGISLPSQRLASGELAFLADEVPPFGSARFHLSPEKPHAPKMPVTVRDNLLDNSILRVRIDRATGNLAELVLHGKSGNLIDVSGDESGNEYLYVQGKDFAEIRKNAKPNTVDGPDIGSIEKSGPARITIEESGPLVAVLRIESSAPGSNSLVRRLRLTAGADWLEISNTVDKKPAPANPDKAASGAWSQYGGKESVQFAFPLSVPGGVMRMDIPLAEMRPELDQLPGTSKNWLPVGRWIDVSGEQLGVTWATLDAPLVEIGEISATLVGGNGNASLWREHIAPTQKFYSWVMNNHWETNYRMSQEGPVEFRYALRAHGGYDPAAASRFSIGLSQPLVASAASSEPPAPSLVRIEPQDVLAIALKPSDDGKALIVRLFGASGQDRQARFHWVTPALRKLWLSDLSQDAIRPIEGAIPVAGWDVVTVRVE